MLFTLDGSLADLGLESLADYSPEVRFAPSRNAVTPDGTLIVTDRPVVAIPGEDGAFSVDLAGTYDLTPAGVWVTVSIRYRNPDGYGAGSGYTLIEFPDLRLYITDDGTLQTAISQSSGSNPVVWWVGLDPPANPDQNTFWLHADPEDPHAGTGDVQRWS